MLSRLLAVPKIFRSKPTGKPFAAVKQALKTVFRRTKKQGSDSRNRTGRITHDRNIKSTSLSRRRDNSPSFIHKVSAGKSIMSSSCEEGKGQSQVSVPTMTVCGDHAPEHSRTNLSFATMLYGANTKQVEELSDKGVLLQRSNVLGDGRCLFRSLIRCLFFLWGMPLSETNEREAADMLRRRAVNELCKHRELLETFFVIEGNFDVHAAKMLHPGTFAGEAELLVLAKVLCTPIAVYVENGAAYRIIQVYGKVYSGEPLRLLYSDGIHYDALLTMETAEIAQEVRCGIEERLSKGATGVALCV